MILRIANFPYKKYLDEFVVKALPEDAQGKLKYLSSLDFINEEQNVILSGNPGIGKTHIAIALGIKACMEKGIESFLPQCLYFLLTS